MLAGQGTRNFLTRNTPYSYYDKHAEAFVLQTIDVDMSALHRRFLANVPGGGSILDAGCGSGRDAKAFKEMNYPVVAFDAAEAMCRSASLSLGDEVLQLKFQDVAWKEEFDGVWACASLLHVSESELGDCCARLLRAVKPSGVIYVSFKHGHGEREENGREFLDMTEDQLNAHLREFREISNVEFWVTPDARPERLDELWLNALVHKR